MASSQEREARPLLEDSQRASSSQTSSKSWYSFIQPTPKPSNGRRVTFAESEVDDEESQGAWSSSAGNSRRIGGLPQLGVYTVLLLLGALVGGSLVRLLWKPRADASGRPPLVPPVWTLPPPTGLPRNEAYLIEAQYGAVASEDITCSELGVSILRDRNGSAVDAAITTTLCIGLFNAFSSGIGGGGFMVVHVPEQDRDTLDEKFKKTGVVAIDFRETSPEASEKEMYGAKGAGIMASAVGGLAVGVPGELRGLQAAHEMYGRLPWEELVRPVAEIAKNGWKVSRELARRLRLFGQFMLDDPVWRAVYAPQGYLAVEGDFIKRTNYGQTLDTIGKHGAGAFYEGRIAENIVKTIKAKGGIMTLKDLKHFEALSYPAIHQTYHNKTIYTTSAPSSGAPLLALLNLVEPYDFASTPEDEGGCLSPLNIHRTIEAMKFAFGVRSEITDPNEKYGANLTRMNEFASKAWANGTRHGMDDDHTHKPEHYGLQFDTPEDHGTTHLSVLDRWGGAASVTTTVNLIWGSHVMDNATGIILNDEQADFSVPGALDPFGLKPSPWNYPAPGKKPLSSTSASIILNTGDSSLYGVLGGSGGSRIFPSLAQVILNLECGLDISAAIERPRVHNQIIPDLTTIEIGPEWRKGEWGRLIKVLEEKGHRIGEFDINLGVSEIQGIIVENGTIYASSDSRKNGIAAGY